jgi:hypothetical protein
MKVVISATCLKQGLWFSNQPKHLIVAASLHSYPTVDLQPPANIPMDMRIETTTPSIRASYGEIYRYFIGRTKILAEVLKYWINLE